MSIGFVGLGNMGGALAERLLLQVPLRVYDLRPDTCEAFAAKGAIAAGSLRALAEQCDIVMTCLPTSAHVEQALFGPDGLVAGARPGLLIADMSTGDPTVTRRLARRLEADHGIAMVDAPVSGGPRGAKAGTIAIMTGGAETALARMRPVFAAISPNVFPCGKIGTGHVMKLVNNMIHAGQKALTFEVLTMGVRNGLSLQACTTVLNKASGRNFTTESNLQSMVDNAMVSTFTLALMHKDVTLATQLARETGCPMPISNIVREMYQIGLTDPGPEEDVNLLIRIYERMSATKVLPPGLS